MQYTQLGRTGLKVSRLCLGTMNFGPQTGESESFAIMDRALDAGFNFFDTANVYGWVKGEGVTEQIVGRWLDQGGGRRERIVLATKVYGDMGDWPNMSRLSALHIRRACDESLRRLKTDHIDLYQMHHIDRLTPPDELWQAMETLIAQGKVIYVGSSNFAAWHIARYCETARARGLVGLVSEQSKYSLLERSVELEVIPACQHYGLGLLPYSPLASGALGGILDGPREGRRATSWAQEPLRQHREQIERWEKLCRDLGMPPAVAALAWLLHQPAVTAPIVGPRTGEQLDGEVAALDVRLDAATLARIDEIFPGYKTAPEHYAW